MATTPIDKINHRWYLTSGTDEASAEENTRINNGKILSSINSEKGRLADE